MKLFARDAQKYLLTNKKMKKIRKSFASLAIAAILMQFAAVGMTTVYAASAGTVVINEVAWAGSADNSNDEWIELYNNSGAAIDLSGWSIEDDYAASTYSITSGFIPARGYFLIEDREEAVDLAADAVIPLSLANTGDTLILKDSSGAIIDSVNSAGLAWYGGNSVTNASMERIDPTVSADLASNWATALSGNGSAGALGTTILGSPRSVNSNFTGGLSVTLNSGSASVNTGDIINVSANVSGGVDLFAYGFELNYDPLVLDYLSANDGALLNSDGEAVSFMSALADGTEGTVLVAGSRLVNPVSGVNGSGALFSASFEVVGQNGASSDISFAASSFISDSFGDIPASFVPMNFSVGSVVGSVDAVANAQVGLGAAQYGLELTWDAPASGADAYIIRRQMVDGSFVVLGQVAALSFTDDDSVVNGGDLVPNVLYSYEVIAVQGAAQSAPVAVTGMETRGLSGDNDRSGRVDGRDLEQLSRSYGTAFGESGYVALSDSNFDGLIDGSDLIDIGANFGLSY